MNDELTEDDVRAAYRWILGREAESDDIVRHFLLTKRRDLLRRSFLDSEEFKLGPNVPLIGRHLSVPAPLIDVVVSEAQMNTLLERTAATWSELGSTEPHWSVLTSDEFLASNIGESEDDFYASGVTALSSFEDTLTRNGLAFPSEGMCIDYGCGVGRLSLALGRRFASVVGVDISDGHRTIAEETTKRRGIDNITFRTVKSVDDILSFPKADFVLSMIVLQHSPPPVMLKVFQNLLAILKPGGIAMIQIPTFHRDYRFQTDEYLSRPRRTEMEMHALPQRHIFRAITAGECELLEIREDNQVADNKIVSNTFLIQKMVVA